jgi:predicted DNA-binding transcriptional regulator AlpA
MAKKRRRHKKVGRLLTRDDLAARGIRYGKTTLRRMWQSGRFPEPKRLSPYKLVWPEEVIDRWVEQRLGA